MEQFLNEYGKTIIIIGMVLNMIYVIYKMIRVGFFSNSEEQEQINFTPYFLSVGTSSILTTILVRLWENREQYVEFLGKGNNIFILFLIVWLITSVLNIILLRPKKSDIYYHN